MSSTEYMMGVTLLTKSVRNMINTGFGQYLKSLSRNAIVVQVIMDFQTLSLVIPSSPTLFNHGSDRDPLSRTPLTSLTPSSMKPHLTELTPELVITLGDLIKVIWRLGLAIA